MSGAITHHTMPLSQRKLERQMTQLGGDSLHTAQISTKMEVKLAQALQQVAALQKENGALQQDVAGMIDLKLQLAEAHAT